MLHSRGMSEELPTFRLPGMAPLLMIQVIMELPNVNGATIAYREEHLAAAAVV
jgi:hypothetical protein